MLLIKNIKIVDGSGEPMRQADVLVSGDKISAIGHFSHTKADVVIDGLGMYLTPGFIETDTHADHMLTLFTHPEQKEYRAQGITTIIGGNDGVSLAPLMYGSLHSFQPWADTNAINVNWRTMAELKQVLARLPLGVNFATMVGYDTIRGDIMNDACADLTDKELAVIFSAVEQALHEGALGISIRLGLADEQCMPYYELTEAAKIAARLHRTLALNLRADDGRLIETISRALTLYKTTGASSVLKNFVPRVANGARIKEFMIAYDSIKNAGDNLFVERTFAETALIPLYELLPRWAQGKNNEDRCAVIKNPSHRKQIAKELPRLQNARIIHAPREYKRLIGKTLEEYARSRTSSFKEAVLAFMDDTKFNAALAAPQDTENVCAVNLMDDPHIVFRGTPRAIFKAADQKRWPIEKTIARMTAFPARAYNLKQRGVIRENYYADLAVMNDRYEITHTIVGGSVEPNAGRFIS